MLLTDKQQLFDSPRLRELPAIASRNAGGVIDVTPTTQQWFQNATKQLIKHAGNIRADEVTPQLLRQFQMAVSSRASNQTANIYLRAIKTIYGRLLKLGFIAHNPATYVPNLPEPPAYPKAMSQGTYEAMRNASDGRDRAILDLLYISGCRIGELRTIEASRIEIEPSKNQLAALVLGKGGKYRYIYATGSQAQSIIQYIEQERPLTKHKQLFISHRGTPLAYHSFQAVIRKARINANIPDQTISNAHSMRHAAAIRWLDDGIDIATVSQWLGHSNPEFTARVYCIRSEAELRRKFFEQLK